MALDLPDCTFFGPALPEPFVKFDLERELTKRKLLRKRTGAEGKALEERWDPVRRKLRDLGDQGGPQRVTSHVIEPLVAPLGYEKLTSEEKVTTREGEESGGVLMTASNGARLRAWAVEVNTNLDAPTRRGRAYRFSPMRVAERVLLAKGERVGLLTDGDELRLLLCDPARPGSHVSIRLDRSNGWRGQRDVPNSFRLLLALASPDGVKSVPEVLDQARLGQSEVTAGLRKQARAAVESFIQELLRHPDNAQVLGKNTDKQALARELWREGLVLVYRLLFIFKLEASPDPARVFSFNASTLWRGTYSPSMALGPIAKDVVERGLESGRLLEDGLRALFGMFADGLRCSELVVSPLGGVLFGRESTRLIDSLAWGEQSVAKLLYNLLWTEGDAKTPKMRVHYGPLDVEDLGRVYEALLELDAGYAAEPMVRLRRDKLEVVVPKGQGERYRGVAHDGGETVVEFVEDVPAGAFFLRAGLGRKATGAYYTPHAFVRFLVQETLDPLVTARSPKADPHPLALLDLRIIDPAMGSGHFLVEACRYLGERLYEACRLCDELASREEEKSEGSAPEAVKTAALARAAELRRRVQELPDPNDELLAWLPSRAAEGDELMLAQARALALCRRLVAVHCLYGVDKNPLAVELAKVTLWLESFAEGLPLTFLDHRLVVGDSLTGPFVGDLLTDPGTGGKLETLFAAGLTERVEQAMAEAMGQIEQLEASIGVSAADLEQKQAAKRRLDATLLPLRRLAIAWTQAAAEGTAITNRRSWEEVVRSMDPAPAEGGFGADALAFDLTFPEVFTGQRRGFDVVLGNPPWEAIRRDDDQFFGSLDLAVFDLANKAEKQAAFDKLLATPSTKAQYEAYVSGFEAVDRVSDRLFKVHQARVGGNLAGRGTYDNYMLFCERAVQLARPGGGAIGFVVPAGFHANEGATGVRRLFFEENQTRVCFSFENVRKLFEIDSRYKFATVVAERGGATTALRCCFYLHDLDWLFQEHEELSYPLDFIRSTGGEYLTLLELRSKADAEVAKACFKKAQPLSEWLSTLKVRLGQEVNMTYESSRFTDTARVLGEREDPREPNVAAIARERGYLPLHEGKTFHQFLDRWEDRPKNLIALEAVADKSDWLEAAQYFRVAFRDIASSTNERTGIFCVLPPGVLCGNKAPVERQPGERSNSSALLVAAVANSFVFDYVLRFKVQATVNLFILKGVPVPQKWVPSVEAFLVHSSLRLTCNHPGYAPLWADQLPGAPAPRAWPVIAELDDRWVIRSCIDAVVANAYGLSRAQYEHVLRSFSHSSYSAAPDLCLGAFDEITKVGMDAFTKRHDPFAETPVVESVAQHVLHLRPSENSSVGELSLSEEPANRRKSRKKKARA